jgi:hypothetical protein
MTSKSQRRTLQLASHACAARLLAAAGEPKHRTWARRKKSLPQLLMVGICSRAACGSPYRSSASEASTSAYLALCCAEGGGRGEGGEGGRGVGVVRAPLPSVARRPARSP